MNRLSKTIWLVLVAAFIVAGCEQRCQEEASVYEPFFDPNFVVPDYASGAIEATGGHQAWTKARELEFDCVVTFYHPDGSFYLTEQHYEIHPWSNLIRISAFEPDGESVWQLSEGRFSVLEGAGQVGTLLPIDVCGYCFGEAILNITTAPVRFLESKAEFTKSSEAVKKEGQWYYPIERSGLEIYEIVQDGSRVIFYQNRDNSLVDMVWFANAAEEKFLAVRGYDYHEVEEKGVCVPSKIEIFRTDDEGVLQERLVKIDF